MHLYVLPVSVYVCIEVLLFMSLWGAAPQPCLLGLLSVARGSVKEPVVFDSVHVRACTSACVCVQVCVCVHACTHAHVCMCVHVWLFVCVHVFSHTCMCVHVCACVYEVL